MMRIRQCVAVLGVGLAALGGPLIGAGAAFGVGSFDSGLCSDPGVVAPGATGGTENRICQGSGLVFVGPQVGQIATVVGPTIIGPGFVGNAVSSAGSVVAGP
jgi:hypothetical protein